MRSLLMRVVCSLGLAVLVVALGTGLTAMPWPRAPRR